MANQTQNALLNEAFVTITNALNNPQLQEALSHYGYTAPRLRTGLERHATAKQLTRQRQRAIQTAKETAELYQSSREQLVERFQMHRELARVAYKREAAHTDHLKLTGARETTIVDLLAQAETFYANVPTAMMEKYHVPRKELNEMTKLVAKVQELQAMQRDTQSQVQSLTQLRLRAIKALQTWMRRFMTVAKVALEEQPQQLEALGQTVTS
ncbi:MAG: hypothetical protein WA960_20735 [Tunicatimonas sp.]